MSTKCTIKYHNGKPFDFHFYRECFDEENVYLQLNGTEYVESHDRYGVTVKIPIEIWEIIKDYTQKFDYANMTDEDIEKMVINEVDTRIERYNSEDKTPLAEFIGLIPYGRASEPREDQIKSGIEYHTITRDRQKQIVEQIEKMRSKNE